jgi:predicted nucleotidyltransferase
VQGRSASDIDLIIVKKTEKRFLDRIEEITSLIEPMFAIDILVYTPEDLQRLGNTSSFVRRALREGTTIYAK